MTFPIAAAVAISGAMLPLAATPLDASATDAQQQPTPTTVTGFGPILFATVEDGQVTDVPSAVADSARWAILQIPTLGDSAITNDPRYKVLGTRRQPPIACDIPEGESSSRGKDICALQLVVAAFRSKRAGDDSGIRSKTDTLNAKCEESDSSNVINHKYVQKALSHLNLGRQVYCREGIRLMVIVSDVLPKVHQKHKNLSSYRNPENVDRLNAIGNDIDALLESEDLYNTFKSSAQVSLLSYADVSGSRDDNDDANESNREYKALWHTRPFAKRIVFYGAIGHGPLFSTESMTMKNDNACQCGDSSSVQYKVKNDKGMYYSVGVKYFPVRHRLAVLLSGGQMRSSMDDTTRTNADTWVSSRWNNWIDLGMNFQLFDVHDKSVIDYIDKRPAVNAEIGLRRDSKYRSQTRWFWRLSVDFREVFDYRKKTDEESKTLSAMLVVEGDSGRFFGHEGGSGWPSTRRLLFFAHADVDFARFLGAG